MTSLLPTSVESTAPFYTRGPSWTFRRRTYVKRINASFVRVYPFPGTAFSSGQNGVPGVSVVICRAAGRQPSGTDFILMLAKASSAWDKYDKDRNGTMSLKVTNCTTRAICATEDAIWLETQSWLAWRLVCGGITCQLQNGKRYYNILMSLN
ncbi:hypothetical protein Vafri_2517 [Volvox africanus]|uniref:Uncharacterized protein n=1 Tax=Volvox africanus TaxID=51714 RepID=A0A8J4ESV0_9CHLO|nr:hypothetical protein Vafri_2517 [Volvox africanus]